MPKIFTTILFIFTIFVIPQTVKAAVTMTALTGGGDTTNTTSYTTASVAPAGDALVLVAIENSKTASAPDIPSLSGNGLTFVQVDTFLNGANTRRLTLFRAMGASPSAGAITIDFGVEEQLGVSWSVSEFSGVDTSGTNGSGAVVQSEQNNTTGTGLTVTLAAFSSANNATYGSFWINSDTTGAVTPGDGFEEIHDIGHINPGSAIFTEWKDTNDTSVDALWVPSVQTAGIAVEIKAADAEPEPPAPRKVRLFGGFKIKFISGRIILR